MDSLYLVSREEFSSFFNQLKEEYIDIKVFEERTFMPAFSIIDLMSSGKRKICLSEDSPVREESSAAKSPEKFMAKSS